MSTRNNKGNYKPKVEKPVEETNYIPQEFKEKYNTPEAKKEIIEKLVEEQAAITDEKEENFLESSVEEIEVQPVDKEDPCTCDETCVCDEQECTDPACVCEKDEVDVEIDKAVEEFKKLPDVEQPKEFHFEFEKDYFLGHPNTGEEVKIDTLPEEPVKAPEVQERKRKTFAQMTATEMNIYHKTGIIPFC